MSDKMITENPSSKPGKGLPSLPKNGNNGMIAGDDKLKKLLARMAEENPEGVADIIRMWLKEDQKNKMNKPE